MPRRSPDYAPLAARYDARYRYDALTGVAAALTALVQERSSRRVLEVGCGTGHWLVHLAPHASHRVGLDLSPDMLAQARAKDAALPLVRGQGDSLPFADASFDVVLCVNALHHFGEPHRFITEAHRLLSPGGVVAIVGMDPRTSPLKWQYQYFPGTFETDLARFPSWGTVFDSMLAAGFKQVEYRPAERIVDRHAGREIFANPFLQKQASSQFALLSDEAYQAGLARLHAAIEEADARGETAVFEMDLTLALLTAHR